MLTGSNSFAGTITNFPQTSPAPVGRTLETMLTLAGSAALPAGTSLAFDLHSQAANSSILTASMDLGGLARKLSSLTVGAESSRTEHINSKITVDLRNGAMEANSFGAYLSAGGTGNSIDLILPDQFQANGGSLQIGTGVGFGTYSSPSLNKSRLLVGANTVLRVNGPFYMGFSGASGKIEPWAPGSSLTITGPVVGTSVSAVSIDIGNVVANTLPGYDSGIDMRDGLLYLTASRVSIRGGSSATAPTMASIRFGGGNVDIQTLNLGGWPQGAFDHQCLVVQGGGMSKVQFLSFGGSSSYTGLNSDKRLFAYQLNGGTLEIGNVSATDVTVLNGSITIGIQWTAGVLNNYPGSSAYISGCSTITLAPLQLALSGPAPKTLEVEAGRSFFLERGTRLSTDSETVAMNVSDRPGAS